MSLEFMSWSVGSAASLTAQQSYQGHPATRDLQVCTRATACHRRQKELLDDLGRLVGALQSLALAADLITGLIFKHLDINLALLSFPSTQVPGPLKECFFLVCLHVLLRLLAKNEAVGKSVLAADWIRAWKSVLGRLRQQLTRRE